MQMKYCGGLCCPNGEMGCGGQRPQVEASNAYVREKQNCVSVRKGSHDW